MPIVVKFQVSGMSAATYDAILRELEAAGAGAPPGRLHHVSYGSPDNLQVIDVFESPQAFESFGKILGPIIEREGLNVQPEVHEAYRIIKG